ncbi:MAG: RNA-binding transcriptional accessory protein [Anaerolineaceae bacterium]|nr:RNA-binding transcriptional accessory protein [Anaerolineaceae bacterium]
MNFDLRLSQICNIPIKSISATIKLLDDGNTIPFLSRYRKELTGNLDEEQLRGISEQLKKLRSLHQRKISILLSIEKQGFLSPDLVDSINSADSLLSLEDIYTPFKLKKHTRASIAKSRGLTNLADLIIQQKAKEEDLSNIAMPFLSEYITSTEEAFAGARDIIAEMISNDHRIRKSIRNNTMNNSKLICKLNKKSQDTHLRYQVYYDFSCNIKSLHPHQILAINRGEKENILKVKLYIHEKEWLEPIQKFFPPDPKSILHDQLILAIFDSASRLLLPAIERDLRRELTNTASSHAVSVFAQNLRSLLSQPPIPNAVILAIDPGFRTGCKIAVVDPTGKLLNTSTIYPHEPQKQWDQAKNILIDLIQKHGVNLIVIGNGTGSRESEQLVAELIENSNLKYLITSEAGASVYSASKLARKELPDLDVTLRGAVSIARRVQDPLAELVKIDPQSIGVGLYQHDLNNTELNEYLHSVVESVVNQVGVDVNTASPVLLSYVAGIGPNLANKIVAYRNKVGQFNSKNDLLNIQGFGEKTFQQAAGFLRIINRANPLDASSIHPESYQVTAKILEMSQSDFNESVLTRATKLKELMIKYPQDKLSEILEIGLPTLTDILEQLVKPGRDIRENLPKPLLRSDIIEINDLKENLILFGTVRNIVDFGIFVDIGVKIDGLLHISKVPDGVNLKIGDIIKVAIIGIQVDRQRISLAWAES